MNTAPSLSASLLAGDVAAVTDSPASSARPGWETTWVPRGDARIWSARRRGDDSNRPTVVFLHGFPDNHHLYDDVVEHLPGVDVLVMDFLGFGDSDKPHPHRYTFDGLLADLDAVIAHHGLGPVVLVPHDISGPAAITWALDHQDRVDGLVLLNTYFGHSATMTPPEIIRLLTAPTGPAVQRVLRAVAFARPWFEPVYRLQLRRMIGDRATSRRVLDHLVAPFNARPSQRHAFTALADDLDRAMSEETRQAHRLGSFTPPVVVAFGDEDYSLDTGVARHLLDLFPHAVDAPVRGSRHFPQLTDPAAVAERVRMLLRPNRTGA